MGSPEQDAHKYAESLSQDDARTAYVEKCVEAEMKHLREFGHDTNGNYPESIISNKSLNECVRLIFFSVYADEKEQFNVFRQAVFAECEKVYYKKYEAQ